MKRAYLAFALLIALAAAPAFAAKETQRDIADAEYSFPIENLSLSGDKVTFTVTSHAHQYDEKSSAVVLSGLYASDRPRSKTCPLVDSHYVRKKLLKYNPLIGKALIVATFKDPAMAAAAVKSGCLLVHDEK